MSGMLDINVSDPLYSIPYDARSPKMGVNCYLISLYFLCFISFFIYFYFMLLANVFKNTIVLLSSPVN